jgi:O-antigen ligase
VAAAVFAFFVADHDLGASLRDEFYGVEADALGEAAGGQWGNRIGFTALALTGAAFLRRADRPWRVRGVLPALLVLVAAWSLASIAWAPDTMRTARRLASLTFCYAGAVGFARRLGGSELCWFVIAVALMFAGFGILVELALGTFRPFVGGRFAGTLHPNGQGANCAFLCLAATTLLTTGDRHRRLLVGLIAFGLVMLLATKSRTALGALLLGAAGVRLLRPTPATIAAGFAAVWLACLGVVVATLLGADLAERASAGLNMGRIEETGTLSGRTDLWDLLDEYARQRPWLGYGYGGFWTPARIEAVSEDQYWGVSSAHSAYVETVLGTGRVGLVLLILVLVAGLLRAGGDFWTTADPGTGLLFGLLLVEVVQGFAESDMAVPSFSAFLLGCALCRVAFFGPPHPEGAP